jgi:RimJ/RimL family protein N-acetyltransferase
MRSGEPVPERARDGRAFVVRDARPEESGAILDYMRDVFEREIDAGVHAPGEFQHTVDSVRAQVRRLLDAPNGLFLVAAAGREIAGASTLHGPWGARVCHVAELTIHGRRAWRGAGVGRALLARTIDAARGSPAIRRITLGVLATNEPACALYASCGFAVEGRRPAHVRTGDGYDDLVLMGLDVV